MAKLFLGFLLDIRMQIILLLDEMAQISLCFSPLWECCCSSCFHMVLQNYFPTHKRIVFELGSKYMELYWLHVSYKVWAKLPVYPKEPSSSEPMWVQSSLFEQGGKNPTECNRNVIGFQFFKQINMLHP